MRNFKLPKRAEIESAFSSFSKREWAFFAGLALLLLISTLGILQIINKSFMVSVPAQGGSVSEGLIGIPRFINPVLASSPADQDLVALVYSGLMRKAPDGTLSPDLAESVEKSEDGLFYTFTLKDDTYFHNGKPVTVEDIIFTITAVQDPVIKSPRRGDWDGVTIDKVDEKTIKFSLKQPYASFLENATLGIMPASLWEGSLIELNNANTNPVGSGPYSVTRVDKQSSGTIDSYELSRFKKFSSGTPYIKKINLHFYSNEEDLVGALLGGEVEQISSITPGSAEILKEKGYHIESSVLPRIFGLFFNQNKNQLFLDKNIIRAMDIAIDKERIVRDVLSGYGVVIDDAIPKNMVSREEVSEDNNLSREERMAKAQEVLSKGGWVKNEGGFLEKTETKDKKKTTTPLTFSISTGNAPELAKSAELIKEDLEALGMKVDIKTFETGNLNQGVIRPREYEVLLFGQIINNESDLFAFWHSSQRKDPGLNVAIYTNAKVDKILEDAFVTIDEEARIKKYIQFSEEIKKDLPAVFLYSPSFIYVTSKDVSGISLDRMTSPTDRFLGVHKWYIATDSVWKIFSPD